MKFPTFDLMEIDRLHEKATHYWAKSETYDLQAKAERDPFKRRNFHELAIQSSNMAVLMERELARVQRGPKANIMGVPDTPDDGMPEFEDSETPEARQFALHSWFDAMDGLIRDEIAWERFYLHKASLTTFTDGERDQFRKQAGLADEKRQKLEASREEQANRQYGIIP